MENSESSINRISRTIWTVWGYLTGAVGRYLGPQAANKDEQEEIVSSVTLNKSYRELKEDEEEKERHEAASWTQSERPLSGVKVRAAAVQWEKVHGGGTSKPTSTGVVCNSAVQKAQEQRDPEEILDNNNEALQTKHEEFVEKVDPFSMDAKVGNKRFGLSRCFDKDADDKAGEYVIDNKMEGEHAEKIEQEEQDLGDQDKICEVSVENIMKQNEDQDEDNGNEQRNRGTNEEEDEASAVQMAADFVSQLTYLTRERGDLLNKEIKVEETTENEAMMTSEREVNDEETQEGTVENDETAQSEIVGSESKLEEAELNFVEGIVEVECKHLVEAMASHMERKEMHENTAELISQSTENGSTLTPEKLQIAVFNKETNQEPVEMVKDVQHQAGQLLSKFKGSGDELDQAGLKLDGAQNKLTEGIVENKCEFLEQPMMGLMRNGEIDVKEAEPICRTVENKVALMPEREPVDEIEEKKHETLSIEVKQKEADVCDSKMDEKHLEETSEKKIVMTPEREVIDVSSEEINQETVGMVKEEGQRLIDSKATDIDVFELDESQAKCIERIVETDCKLLEEPVKEHLKEMYEEEAEPISYSIQTKPVLSAEREPVDTNDGTNQEIMGTSRDGHHRVDQQRSEGSEITNKLDIHESDLVEAQNEFIAEPEAGLLKINTESGDDDLSEIMMEYEEDPEAGDALELALKTEVRLLDLTACDLIGSQIPEVVSMQDKLVVGLGNQFETSETMLKFQQEARAEVAAHAVKQPAKMEESLRSTARQEVLGQCILEPGSLQEKLVGGGAHELGLLDIPFSEMQRDGRKFSSTGQVDEAAHDEKPSTLPQELGDQQDDIKTSVALVTKLAAETTKPCFTEQKVEVLEEPALGDCGMVEVEREQAESRGDLEKEVESSLAIVEMLKKSTGGEAPVQGDASESLIPQNPGEQTVQDGSGGETDLLGQIRHSGILDLPERESAFKVLMLGSSQDEVKDSKPTECKTFDGRREPEKESVYQDETEVGLLKAMTASLGDIAEIRSELGQDSDEDVQSLSKKTLNLEAGMNKTKEETFAVEISADNGSDLQTSNELSSNVVENEQNLQVKIDTDAADCEEIPQNATEDHVENDDAATEVDSKEIIQERSRSGLKRGSEKMTRHEADIPSLAKGLEAQELFLQQVSSLDCTVQKSKIALKNRFTRPPKNPRTLLNLASVEPLAPPHPVQLSLLKKGQGEGHTVAQKGVIGFKLPGLGAGLPVLRKTEAGQKMRDGVDAGSETQKPDGQTDQKVDSADNEQPVTKPKWTPPRHPGMGNPLMMSELKSKLRKTGKD